MRLSAMPSSGLTEEVVKDRLLSLKIHRLAKRQWDPDRDSDVWEYVEPTPFQKLMWALRDEQNAMR